MNSLLPPEIAMVVGPDERVLWTGRAGPVGPGAEGCFGGCFGVFFAGFAIFWTAMAGGAALIGGRGGAPGPFMLFPLFGVPFILVGLYVIVSSVYWTPKRKGSGVYAVTDRRILFIRTFPKIQVKEIPLSPNLRVEQSLESDGSGTLAFLDPVSVHDPEGMTISNPRHGPRRVYRSENMYTFHRIPDAAQVAQLVQSLIRR